MVNVKVGRDMGKKSKTKGYRGEAEIVKKLQDRGVNCIRVPMSGSIWSWKGDIDFLNGIKGEVKRRKKINRLFYDMLEEATYGFIRGDNKPWLVVMELEDFVELYNREEK